MVGAKPQICRFEIRNEEFISWTQSSSIEVVFDFLVAYSNNLEKELAKTLKDKKVVNVTIERFRNG